MSVQFHLSTYLLLGDGQFDSRYRYIRQVANPADKTLNMVRGQSLSHSYANLGSNSTGGIIYAWNCNGIEIVGNASLSASYPQIQKPVGFNVGLNIAL